MNIKLPIIEKYEIKPSIFVDVVRCDTIEGGFKRLIIDGVYSKSKSDTLVFASNSLGSGPLALTSSLQGTNKKVIIFLSKLDTMSQNLELCKNMGAQLDFSGNADAFDSDNLRKEALEKYATSNYEVLPIGLANEEVTLNIVKIAKEIFSKNIPKDLWIVAASGMTLHGLQIALPETRFHAVLVKGNNPDIGNAQSYKPVEEFTEKAKITPPYPANNNYDAKIWGVLLDSIGKEDIGNGTVVFNIAK
jgi:hypothetical protein